MMTMSAEPRRREIYHKPERSDGIYRTIAPLMGICADCINRYVVQRPGPQRRKRARA